MRQSLILDMSSDLPLTSGFQFTVKGKYSFFFFFFPDRLNFLNHLRKRNPYEPLIFQYLVTSVQNGSQAGMITSGPKLWYFFPQQESIHLQLSSFPSLQEEDKSRKDDSEREKEKDKNREKLSERPKIRMLSKGESAKHFLTLLIMDTRKAKRHCKPTPMFTAQGTLHLIFQVALYV